MMKRPRLLSLALTSLLLAAVAGCGSSSDDSTGGSSGGSEAGTSLADVRDAGVITVGTEGTYPPFTFHEGGSGELTGYDVDVIKAVADRLGVEAQFEETQFDAIFAGLEAGRFDVIANQVSIDPERQAKYDFSKPYTVSPGVVVVTKDDDSINSFDDLAGKTTAQSLTSNWYQMAQDAGANVESVEGWAQAVTLLKQGRVDATVNDELTFLDYQKTEHDTDLKIAAKTTEEAHNAFAFRKGSTSLVKAVDKALAQLRQDGTLAKISEKYFGADVSK
jgi:L-cystine transport system substrate-binding protein